MNIVSLEQIIRSDKSNEDKIIFLEQHFYSIVDTCISQQNLLEIKKILSILLEIPKELNPQQKFSFYFSNQFFSKSNVIFFNKSLKEKDLFNFFNDNSNLLSSGLLNTNTKNLYSYYKKSKNPFLFTAEEIYENLHLFEYDIDLSIKITNLYEKLKVFDGKEPLYIPYHIIRHAIKSNNVNSLNIGFGFINDTYTFKKVIIPILWEIYNENNLISIQFLEKNEHLFKDYNLFNADMILEFLDQQIYLSIDDLRFFNYVLPRTFDKNKEIVNSILEKLKDINLSFNMFSFIFSLYSYLKISKNSKTYILEELILSNGVIELIEIIKE